MPRQIDDLLSVLNQLISEHEKLLASFELQRDAMKKLNVAKIDEINATQENARMRIIGLENRRRQIVKELALILKIKAEPTLIAVAAACEPSRPTLLNLRQKLKNLVAAVSNRAKVSGKVANSVLGHLNTAVRLFSGGPEKAGIYNRHGSPQISRRIGLMEAVA
jgi:hypothetical protein